MVCEDQETNEPLGLIWLSFEWSDWRNKCFYWIQMYWAKDHNPEVIQSMKSKLHEYGQANNYAGLRMQTEKEHHSYFTPLIKVLELEAAHYFVYHVDTIQ